jgi:hypothetical protein
MNKTESKLVEATTALRAAACTYSLFLRRAKPAEKEHLEKVVRLPWRELSDAAVAYALARAEAMATINTTIDKIVAKGRVESTLTEDI